MADRGGGHGGVVDHWELVMMTMTERETKKSVEKRVAYIRGPA